MMLGELIKGILGKDKLVISKAITLVENEAPIARSLLRALHKSIGKAFRIGITGPMGVGKSTLINALAILARSKRQTVGIVAVDPTSPFSGGAMLGDRIRMDHFGMDEDVFIRSMATRGYIGGLSKTAYEAVDILDASGKDLIFIETIGIGQADIEVARLSDCVVLVLSPESGDSIQAMKSGFMEIADLLVVNKSDRPGGERLKYELESILSVGKKRLPVFLTSASASDGVMALFQSIEGFLQAQRVLGDFQKRRRENTKARILSLVQSNLRERVLSKFDTDPSLDKLVEEVISGEISIYEASNIILKDLG